MKNLTFSPLWDVLFDHNGVTVVPSGTAPYVPNSTRLLVRNVEPTTIKPIEDEACSKAAFQGIKALRSWVEETFKGKCGRAADALEYSLYPNRYCEEQPHD